MVDALDSNTLLACESLLALVFVFVFLGVRRIFPEGRGARAVALSLLLVLPNTLVVALRAHMPAVVSVLMASTLMLGALIAMYEGVLAYTGGPNYRWGLWCTAFGAFALGYFFTEIHPAAGPCMIVFALAMANIRGFTAFALLRRSHRSTQRGMLRCFGIVMALLTCQGVYRAWRFFRLGMPPDLERQRTMQAMTLISGVFFLAIAGFCFLMLTSRDLVARRRREIERDPVSGRYIRQGLEGSMALEMERLRHQGDALTVAVVAVDDMGLIESAGGHEAADAALRAVAETIAAEMRSSDQIQSFSGDSFLLLFAKSTHDEALVCAERMAAAVGRLRSLSDGRPLTVSMGLTESVPGDTAGTLVERAERALGEARAAGQNCRRVVLAERVETGGASEPAVA